MRRVFQFALAMGLLATAPAAWAQAAGQPLPEDFSLPPGDESAAPARQGPELRPVPRSTPTPSPSPSPAPTSTATGGASEAPARVSIPQLAEPLPSARAPDAVRGPARTVQAETAPIEAPIAESAASPESPGSAAPEAETAIPAASPASPSTVEAPAAGGGEGVSGLWWWLVPGLLLAGLAVFAFLRLRGLRESQPVVEKIEPYRPPPAPEKPAQQARAKAAPAGLVQPQPARPAQPAVPAQPSLSAEGYVTSSIVSGAPRGTVQLRRPAAASPPDDGRVYARPIGTRTDDRNRR